MSENSFEHLNPQIRCLDLAERNQFLLYMKGWVDGYMAYATDERTLVLEQRAEEAANDFIDSLAAVQ